MEERFQNRLSMWKKAISFYREGDSPCLEAAFPISQFISSRYLEKGQSKAGVDLKIFPLRQGKAHKKPHLVIWSIACLDKKYRGLSINSLSILNKTFFI